MSKDMHVDIRYTKVCALCEFWLDPVWSYIEPSNVPNHFYYDSKARRRCIAKKCDTYGGQPGCQNYKCKCKI